MVEAIQTLHLHGGAPQLMAALWLCAVSLLGSWWEATGAHVALANAAGLKVLFFAFFFPLQIYQIPRCLTLKQRLQTLPTSRPEISQVGSQLLVLSPLHRAGGGAGQQQGMGVLVLLLVCALAVQRRTKSSCWSWFFRDTHGVCLIRCCLWGGQGRSEVAAGPLVSRVEATRMGPRLWGWAVGPPHFHGRAVGPLQSCCSGEVLAGTVGLVLPVGPWPRAALPAF